MPIIVSEIKIAPGEPKEKAFEKAFSVLKIKSSEANSVSVSKISVDARKKDRVSLVFSVAVCCENEEKIAERAKAKNVTYRKNCTCGNSGAQKRTGNKAGDNRLWSCRNVCRTLSCKSRRLPDYF